MPQLIFVIDPMCSWCWGFQPIVEKLRTEYKKKFQYSLIVGGLRTKGQMEWNEQNKKYLAQNWHAVAKRTGQTFNFSLLNKPIFDYDTYPACKAIVTMRELWGEEQAFELLYHLQKAFYVKGEDITSLESILNYIKEEERFLKFYRSERATILMQHDFSKARSMGANSFPSVIKIDNEGHMVCEKGYREFNKVLKS